MNNRLKDLLETGTPEIMTTIDWISVTADYVEPARYVVPKEIRMFEEWKLTKGRLGYNVGARHITGAIQLHSTTEHRMGIHVIYSGKAIVNIEEHKMLNKIDLLQYHMECGHRIVRLDLAVDFINAGVTVDDFQHAFGNGEVVTRARSGTVVQSLTGRGHTFYIGSRKARKKLLRIYDKGAEQNLDVDWLRVEMQIMGTPAEKATSRIAKSSQKSHTIIGIIQGYCDFPTVSMWKRATHDVNATDIGSIRHERGGTRKWLETQVMSALVDECLLDIDYYVQYTLMLDKELKRRRKT